MLVEVGTAELVEAGVSVSKRTRDGVKVAENVAVCVGLETRDSVLVIDAEGVALGTPGCV